MDDERWQKIQAIFEEAAERPPDQRARFLDEACGENREIRAEVERLLSHDSDAPSGFMRPRESESPARWTSSASETDALVGTTIGRYRIKGVIDAGGMGTVYLAEQASPKRDVALKILRAGIASRSVMKRFEYESQILARLRHPNIAQVYEAGVSDQQSAVSSQLAEPAEPPLGEGGGHKRTERGSTVQRGVPYFAMEYVPDARTITEYADASRLSIRQRLELFLQACDAVHYGHQRGVIHRDLKPGNILVSDEAIERRSDVDTRAACNLAPCVASSPRGSVARCKLIDFGVARCTDSDIAVTTMHTDVGQLIGTLQYMSPEQCAADALEIDTRSDVYSLGVVMYELLTGRLPYDVSNMTIHSAARVICEREPAKPSGFQRRLRGDLEIILLKALEKDREKRYASAAALAEDVHRHLRGEPISARPPAAWARGVRWVGRHPVLATTCLCLFIAAATTAATSVAVWYQLMRPDRIVRYRDGKIVDESDRARADEVRLIARGGKELHTWGGAADSIAFADLVGCPEEFGEARLAVIGFRGIGQGSYSRQLCAFDIDGDLHEPVWAAEVSDDEVLPELRRGDARGLVGKDFCAYHGLLADVFPGPQWPGEEIVCVFATDRSPRIIRIYNLAGDKLYEFWHDGSVALPRWLSGPRLLVFCGDSHLDRWDENGSPIVSEPNPLVVFAIRPQPGLFHDSDYLPTAPRDDAPSPAWYKCIYIEDGKPATYADFSPDLRPASTAEQATRYVELLVKLRTDMIASWLLDEFGNAVSDTLSFSDPYEIALKQPDSEVPDPEKIKLGPMPPLPEAAEAAGQASAQGEGERE